jgi:hypothetical protein
MQMRWLVALLVFTAASCRRTPTEQTQPEQLKSVEVVDSVLDDPSAAWRAGDAHFPPSPSVPRLCHPCYAKWLSCPNRTDGDLEFGNRTSCSTGARLGTNHG